MELMPFEAFKLHVHIIHKKLSGGDLGTDRY